MKYSLRWGDINVDPKAWHRCKKQIDHPVRQVLSKTIKSLECKSVLDVACGTGTSFIRLNKLPEMDYVGTDITVRFLKVAHNEYYIRNVVRASVTNLPFKDNAFEVVTCKDILEHLEPLKWIPALEEMCRVASRFIIPIFFNLFCSSPTKSVIGPGDFYYSHINLEDVRAVLCLHDYEVSSIKWGIGNPTNQLMVAEKLIGG